MGRKIVSDSNAEQSGHPLYVDEWFERLGFADQQVADRLGVSRVTVFRWRQHPHRLNPPKLSLLASVLGIRPEDFWFSPEKPSLDYRLRRLNSLRRAELLPTLLKLLNDR